MRQIDNKEGNGIWHNARIAPAGNPDDIIEDGAIVVRDGTISWIGNIAAMPIEFAGSALPRHDVGRRWVTPGLIDCHTHLVYAGNRAREFELRLGGAHYAEIARAGGGILSTVRATRAAAPSLAALSESRFAALTDVPQRSKAGRHLWIIEQRIVRPLIHEPIIRTAPCDHPIVDTAWDGDGQHLLPVLRRQAMHRFGIEGVVHRVKEENDREWEPTHLTGDGSQALREAHQVGIWTDTGGKAEDAPQQMRGQFTTGATRSACLVKRPRTAARLP